MIWTCLWLVSLWCGCAESAEAQVRDDEYKDFLSSIQTEFYAFEDSINRDFANYLEQAWQEFTVYEGTEQSEQKEEKEEEKNEEEEEKEENELGEIAGLATEEPEVMRGIVHGIAREVAREIPFVPPTK